MRIHQILGVPSIILTNEEHKFVMNHKHSVSLNSLYGREEVVAQNLVRKGVYETANEGRDIVLISAQLNKTLIGKP